MLYNKLREDLTNARKARDLDKVSLLSTVIGEMAANAVLIDGQKIVDDAAASQVLKKTIKGLEELNAIVASEKAQDEAAILKAYLPQQMTEEELKSAITMARSQGATNLGAIMGWLKTNHSGLYDGKIASAIAKEQLG